MSEVVNEANKNSNGDPYRIEIGEHDKFPDIGSFTILTSTEFCQKLNPIFKSVYYDFKGSRLDIMPGTNLPIVTLFFNPHNYELKGRKIVDERGNEIDAGGKTLATSKVNLAGSTKSNSEYINRLSRNYNARINGGRYFLTNDGAKGIGPFIIGQKSYIKGYTTTDDGTPDPIINYKKAENVITTTSDPTPGFMPRSQVIQVSFIDPNLIMEAVYGSKDKETGCNLAYSVTINESVPSQNAYIGQNSSIRTVLIMKSFVENVFKAASTIGYNVGSSLNIVTS